LHSRISISGGGEAGANVTQEGDAEVRRGHVNLIEVEEVDDEQTRNMASESQATLTSSKSRSRRKDGRRGSEERKHRRRRTATVKEDGPEYVHAEPIRRTKSRPEKRSGSDADDSEEEVGRVKVGKSKPRKVRYVYVTEVDETPRRRSQKKERHKSAEELPRRTEESIKRSRSHQTRRKSVVDAPPLQRYESLNCSFVQANADLRSTSTRDIPSTSRPSIKRSKTTTSHVPSSATPTSTAARRSSFMGGLFGGPPKPVVPEKL
jgi:hypothetical protein